MFQKYAFPCTLKTTVFATKSRLPETLKAGRLANVSGSQIKAEPLFIWKLPVNEPPPLFNQLSKINRADTTYKYVINIIQVNMNKTAAGIACFIGDISS